MSSAGQFIYTETLYRLPKRVIVLLPGAWTSLAEEELTLLKKILTAVRLSLDSVQILVRTEVNLDSLNTYNPSVVISFGTQLQPSVTPYQSNDKDGVRIIQSDALNQLDDVKKKNLWNALKQAFAA